jgi:hypothetical protein
MLFLVFIIKIGWNLKVDLKQYDFNDQWIWIFEWKFPEYSTIKFTIDKNILKFFIIRYVGW